MTAPTSPRSPAPGWLHTAAVAAAALGLATSLALLVDYLRPEPAFCGAGGGCASVRASAWSHPLGVPLPLPGVVFFALALALLHVPRARRALPWVAVLGALVATGLLILQGAVLGTWCKLCVVTDTSALVLAALVLATRGRGAPASGALGVPVTRSRLALGAGFAAVAVGAPLVAAVLATPPAPPLIAVTSALPDAVAREQRAGVVTVVDFIDFECPFCRRLHPRLEAAIAAVAASGAPVRVVKKMVPLERLHPHALAAAIAWCCADEQGAGDAMAEALFAAPPDELTPEGCERIASRLGLDLERYRRCADAPATRARIAADTAAARAAGVSSLPTLYIGDRAFVGAGASQADLEAALRSALATL